VFAPKGADTFLILDSCTRDASRAIVWRAMAQESAVALEPPAPIDAAPQFADVDGDGHLDVLVGALGRAYVSYGDGHALSVATPYQLPFVNTQNPATLYIPMPLAAGDFTGDGVIDFVFGDHLLVSRIATLGTPPVYVADHANLGARWTEAKIADLNGNGKPDVVAASSGALDVDFFNGTGAEHLTAFSLPTNGPVQHLAVGDVDGDLVDDLAFVETAAAEGERDTVMIAFGTLARPPSAPLAVARVGHAVQLTVYYQGGVAFLLVSSDETVDGRLSGALAQLDGGGDRIPFAPYELTSFASDGSVQGQAALGLAVGHFSGTEKSEALVLASGTPVDNPLQFWLVRLLDSANTPPIRFAEVLGSRLEPLSGSGFDGRLNLAGVSADLDRDGHDEAVFAMPADQQQHCGLVVVGVTPGASTALVTRGTIVLDQPCRGPDLLPVDADGDGSVDLALLTGSTGLADRKLLVVWNNGKGEFSNADVSTVNGPDQSPRAFTALGATALRPFGFAYVTDQAALLASATATRRQFAEARVLTPLRNGSGIVAADVNGDGVADLALASSGNLTVLKAQLKTP
jgi:hypothetical protein